MRGSARGDNAVNSACPADNPELSTMFTPTDTTRGPVGPVDHDRRERTTVALPPVAGGQPVHHGASAARGVFEHPRVVCRARRPPTREGRRRTSWQGACSVLRGVLQEPPRGGRATSAVRSGRTPRASRDRVRERGGDRVVRRLAHRLGAERPEVVVRVGEEDLGGGDVGHLRHVVVAEHRVVTRRRRRR